MSYQPFSEYIKAIGKGKRGARHLSQDEAFDAMSQVLDQHASPEQTGAFLMLLRMQEESVDELRGFIQACRERLPVSLQQINADLDIGCYAGKRRQLPWYLLSVALLAKQGRTIFLHGASEPGSNRFYASHALEQLGLPLASSIDQAQQHCEAYKVCYLDLGIALPELERIIKLRTLFGLRSCANTLARLVNPSTAPFAIQGVYHTHLDARHGAVNETFTEQTSLVFRGDGGDPEVNRERDTHLYFSAQGQTRIQCLPAAQTWALKEQVFEVSTMLEIWQGKGSHGYGEQAVLATLTAYLMLLDDLTLEEAQQQAQACWHNREKQALPFG